MQTFCKTGTENGAISFGVSSKTTNSAFVSVLVTLSIVKRMRYIVRYRDTFKDAAMNFGPFVSENIAINFAERLPEPLQGGFKTVHPLQPFTVNDSQRIANQITRDRLQTPVTANH